MREICASGSVGGEGGNILVYPARSPIVVIIDRFAGDRQLFWVYGRYTRTKSPLPNDAAVSMRVSGKPNMLAYDKTPLEISPMALALRSRALTLPVQLNPRRRCSGSRETALWLHSHFE
jgi:hypothetical protein